jgi:glycosyltransferase involved in cell wall biosynthesis
MAVCCLDVTGSWAAGLEREGIEVTALGRTGGFQPALGTAVARAAARHRATVVHAHHYSPFVYSAIARFRAPSRGLIFTEHGRLSDDAPSGRRRLANRLLGWAPHRVLTVSADLRSHLVAEGFRTRSVAVIYNGIDPAAPPTPADRVEARRQLGVPAETLVVGTIARLDPVKDLASLIDAVGLLSDRLPVGLVIVGDGPELPRLREHAATRGLNERVTFLGHRDDARRWLPAFDVFVNSSVSEGVSLTILEAMAAERPVVATAVGGTPEVVDELSGRLVPSRNPEALASAIHTLWLDQPLRLQLGRQARQRVLERFTLDGMIRAYARLYDELSARRRGGGV